MQRVLFVTSTPSTTQQHFHYFSEDHKIIAMHRKQIYRLRNVRAGYVLYRALIIAVTLWSSFSYASVMPLYQNIVLLV